MLYIYIHNNNKWFNHRRAQEDGGGNTHMFSSGRQSTETSSRCILCALQYYYNIIRTSNLVGTKIWTRLMKLWEKRVCSSWTTKKNRLYSFMLDFGSRRVRMTLLNAECFIKYTTDVFQMSRVQFREGFNMHENFFCCYFKSGVRL